MDTLGDQIAKYHEFREAGGMGNFEKLDTSELNAWIASGSLCHYIIVNQKIELDRYKSVISGMLNLFFRADQQNYARFLIHTDTL